MRVIGSCRQPMDIKDVYLSGEALYGDDFDSEQVSAWYADEKEGYSSLGAKDPASYRYVYHALNAYHAYRFLPATSFDHALGFGAAYGDEFLPIAARIGAITVVDPSEVFRKDRIGGVAATWVKPSPDGRLPLESGTFDLITCLGVLHHIPNVSFVVGELARVLRPGGWMVMREPIHSMGDWTRPRRGLTKRERGIPVAILRRIVQSSGLETRRMSFCGFPAVPRLFHVVRPDIYNSPFAVRVDSLLSAMFSWNVSYHPRTFLQRLRPTSVFLILGKPKGPHDAGPAGN